MRAPVSPIPECMGRTDMDSCYLDFDQALIDGDAALLAWAKQWGPYVAEIRRGPAWRNVHP